MAANTRWYAGLAKPTFAPGVWLAVPLAAGTGCFLSLALIRVLGRPDYLPDRPGALRLVGIMLGLGVVWAWSFFGSRHPSLGLLSAAVMIGMAGATAWRFAAVDRRAGLLMLPVLLATVFAATIELSISVKN